MTLINIFSEHAEKAAERYLSVIFGLRGTYSRSFGYEDPTTPKAMKDFKENSYSVARTYLETETRIIKDMTEEIALWAITDALSALGATTPAEEYLTQLRDHLNGSGDYIRNEISIQLERDIASAAKKLKDLGLRSYILQNRLRISKKASIVQLRLSDKGELRFYFVDRQNRKWPSQKFIRTIWRAHMLDIYNEVYLYVLASHGVDTFAVKHTDVASKVNGQIFDLEEFEDIRDEIFHPNANAVVSFDGGEDVYP